MLTIAGGDIPILVKLGRSLLQHLHNVKPSRPTAVLLHPFTPSSCRRILYAYEDGMDSAEFRSRVESIAGTGSLICSIVTSAGLDARALYGDYLRNVSNLLYVLDREDIHYVLLDTSCSLLIDDVVKLGNTEMIIITIRESPVEAYSKRASLSNILRIGKRRSELDLDETGDVVGIHFYTYVLHDYASIIDILCCSRELRVLIDEANVRGEATYRNVRFVKDLDRAMKYILARLSM
ncbi:MAG: hypothetical protein GXO26_01445 [Crenarchaeota archaeon]|nr:hypothetical protein [Thermoproteota archaeon]